MGLSGPPSPTHNENSQAQARPAKEPPLPKVCFGYPLYLYRGFWCPGFSLGPTMAFQTHFEARDTDIFVINMPKTGTTWFKSLLFSIINRSSQGSTKSSLLTHNPHELVHSLEIMVYTRESRPTEALDAMSSPRLLSTHVPYASLPESIKRSKCKIIYITRNPLDTFVSSWLYYSKLEKKNNNNDEKTKEEYFDMFCEGESPYGPFFDHVTGYWEAGQERPDKVLFVKYEDLKGNAEEEMKRVARFVGRAFSDEEEEKGRIEEITRVCSIESLRGMEVNKKGKCDPDFNNSSFFRKGEVGDWVNHMTPEMVNRLNRIMEEQLKGSGLIM